MDRPDSSFRGANTIRPIFVGRRVALAPLMPEHYRPLYEQALAPGVVGRWEPSLQGGSFEAWARRLFDGVFCQFAVVSVAPRTRGSLQGLVRCYGANFRHGTAQLSVFMGEGTHGSGAGLEALGLLVDFLFRQYPFRKLYGESISFNFAQFASGAGKLFDVEGRLRRHEMHNGSEHDCFILAIHRDKWREVGAKKVARMRPPALRHVHGGDSTSP